MVRLLILGTGGMAGNHAEAFAAIPGVEIVAGVDTRPAQLAAFCDRHGVAGRFASLDEALDWGRFDAVTNVTPDAAHHPTTLPLLAAGKHVLCQQPRDANHTDAAEMAAAAAAAGVVNMINLSYRNVPAVQKAAALVRDGAIGAVRHFEASYLQSWLTQPAWGDWRTQDQWLWRLSTRHGSKGVLGDVGIHILDYATFIAADTPTEVSCRLKTFDKAEGGRIGHYVLDANDSFVMHLELAGGAVGTVAATRFASGHLNDLRLRIYGETGGLEVGFERGESRLTGSLGADMPAATWAAIEAPIVPTIYERFIGAIRGEGPGTPDFARGADLQGMLDLAEASAAAGGTSLSLRQ
jgi:predicted dehydrogenase